MLENRDNTYCDDCNRRVNRQVEAGWIEISSDEELFGVQNHTCTICAKIFCEDCTYMLCSFAILVSVPTVTSVLELLLNVGDVQTIFALVVYHIIVQVLIVQKTCVMSFVIPGGALNVAGVMHLNTQILKLHAKCWHVMIALKCAEKEGVNRVHWCACGMSLCDECRIK